ncbi:MAG: branched-chain amino acid transport system substrate-binding protein [Actinomycetota bacterium]|nr:branched-chain amino acid transport system substrate-binding protein [Actinomycetota bacterium]
MAIVPLVRRRLAILLLVLLLPACSSDSGPGTPTGTPSGELLVVVNAPFSRSPYIGESIFRGVTLAIDEINAAGGIKLGDKSYRLAAERLDNALSPQKALANVRSAVERGAAVIVDEGTGVDASWAIADEADIPIGIVYQGGIGLVDPVTKPNVFRITPTDHGIAFRLAEYMLPQDLDVAFLYDDSDYGQQGKLAVDDSFGRVPNSLTAIVAVPSTAPDVTPQVLEARRSGATALLVWARSSTVAKVIRAARSNGWDVPIYTAPSGEDPLVRQQLSDHPEWVDGLTVASGRMTAEKGPEPFLAFMAAYESKFGLEEVGVETADGRTVVQPPDYAMYPYDFVRVFAAAVGAAQTTEGPLVIDALNQVDVQGANGDERGFNEKNHEGVVDDDVYFARFHDMVFDPVQDDPLSSTLETIPQTR